MGEGTLGERDSLKSTLQCKTTFPFAFKDLIFLDVSFFNFIKHFSEYCKTLKNTFKCVMLKKFRDLETLLILNFVNIIKKYNTNINSIR